MRLGQRSCIMAVHRRHAGEKLGYGGVYTLDHDADVAIVGVGYGDGLYLPLVEMHGDILVRESAGRCSRAAWISA